MRTVYVLMEAPDYDWVEPEGVFDTITELKKYFRRNNMKPNYYEIFRFTSNTQFTMVSLKWCEWKGCHRDDNLARGSTLTRVYCIEHLPLALKEQKKLNERIAINDEIARKREEAEKERIKQFEIDNDLVGKHYAILPKALDGGILGWSSGSVMPSGTVDIFPQKWNDVISQFDKKDKDKKDE